jgi:hypothetical protein
VSISGGRDVYPPSFSVRKRLFLQSFSGYPHKIDPYTTFDKNTHSSVYFMRGFARVRLNVPCEGIMPLLRYQKIIEYKTYNRYKI